MLILGAKMRFSTPMCRVEPMAQNAHRKIISLSLLLMMAVVLWATPGSTQNPGSQQTWQGYVTDTHCGTNCQITKNMTPDKKCIDRCIRRGSKYGLWAGRHVCVLEPQGKAARYAGINVSVKGALDGETIHIDSIEPRRELPDKNHQTTKRSAGSGHG